MSRHDHDQHLQTERPDGCYISFTRLTGYDDAANTGSDETLRELAEHDPARAKALRAGEWHYIGVFAVAYILTVSNQVSTAYSLRSPGLWGVESDSSAEHLDEIYQAEIAILKRDLGLMARAVYVEN